MGMGVHGPLSSGRRYAILSGSTLPTPSCFRHFKVSCSLEQNSARCHERMAATYPCLDWFIAPFTLSITACFTALGVLPHDSLHGSTICCRECRAVASLGHHRVVRGNGRERSPRLVRRHETEPTLQVEGAQVEIATPPQRSRFRPPVGHAERRGLLMCECPEGPSARSSSASRHPLPIPASQAAYRNGSRTPPIVRRRLKGSSKCRWAPPHVEWMSGQLHLANP
jgi:hypothetical protein